MNIDSVLADIKRLSGKSAIYGLGSIILRVIGFALLPIYTRFLTPADYGILAVAGIVSSILGILLSLSLHASLNPIYFRAAEQREKRAALGTVWLALVILSGAMTILLDQVGSSVFSLFFRNVPFNPYIRLAIWAAFLNVFGLVPLNLLQIQERAALYVLFTVINVLLQIGLVLFFLVICGLGAQGYLMGTLLGALVMALPFSWLVLCNVRPTWRWGFLKRALAYSLPLVPHALSGWVLDLSDRAILERFVSLEELGLYSLGYIYGSAMNMVAYAINSAWVPYLFQRDAHENGDSSYHLARLGTYFAAFLCFVALALGLFSKEVIRLMTTPAFFSAARVAPWIVAGWLLSGLYYFPINFLFLRQKTAAVPLATMVSGLLNIGLNLWLVPLYGIMAAAWVTFISYGLMLVLAWWLGFRAYPLPYEYGRLAKVGVTTLMLWISGSLIEFPNLAWSVAAKSFLLAAYPLALLIFGFFLPSEKQHVSHCIGALFGRLKKSVSLSDVSGN